MVYFPFLSIRDLVELICGALMIILTSYALKKVTKKSHIMFLIRFLSFTMLAATLLCLLLAQLYQSALIGGFLRRPSSLVPQIKSPPQQQYFTDSLGFAGIKCFIRCALDRISTSFYWILYNSNFRAAYSWPLYQLFICFIFVKLGATKSLNFFDCYLVDDGSGGF